VLEKSSVIYGKRKRKKKKEKRKKKRKAIAGIHLL
jgi:hypothetical protein